MKFLLKLCDSQLHFREGAHLFKSCMYSLIEINLEFGTSLAVHAGLSVGPTASSRGRPLRGSGLAHQPHLLQALLLKGRLLEEVGLRTVEHLLTDGRTSKNCRTSSSRTSLEKITSADCVLKWL